MLGVNNGGLIRGILRTDTYMYNSHEQWGLTMNNSHFYYTFRGQILSFVATVTFVLVGISDQPNKE